ncbi:hypothetical protein D3C81_1916990 [compost metagenome]
MKFSRKGEKYMEAIQVIQLLMTHPEYSVDAVHPEIPDFVGIEAIEVDHETRTFSILLQEPNEDE